METLGAVAATFTAIGFGGVIGAFVQHRFQAHDGNWGLRSMSSGKNGICAS